MKYKLVFSLALLSMGYSDEFFDEEATPQIETIIADIAEEINTVSEMMQPPVETIDQQEIAWGFKSTKPELNTVPKSPAKQETALTIPLAETEEISVEPT